MANTSGGKTALGLDSNIGALLCYIHICGVGLIYSIIVLVTDKTNKLPRFHAFQSLLMLAVFVILYFVAGFIIGIGAGANSAAIASLGLLINVVIGLALLILIIFGAMKAYQGQIFKLPVIGDLADKWSN